LSLAAEERCARAHDRLSRLIAEGRHVYGLTTGFGPLANRLVGSGNGVALRQNLILPAAHAVTVLDDDFTSYGPTRAGWAGRGAPQAQAAPSCGWRVILWQLSQRTLKPLLRWSVQTVV
jgi:hypothetical protein